MMLALFCLSVATFAYLGYVLLKLMPLSTFESLLKALGVLARRPR